ncbi:cell surface glycoprotein (s-layer protein)-like protein [Anaeramoeba flamelloides]|uniref:Cell surface glycoprotein (S-layer protein)-like protein n=1 Tax=Anaeramoeba flamelloides TaxID=1746091 RepID=A0ABQ8YYT5_9EUKA|nr:cell surface glycoprotein (s-layer protein)-like protein [Anaeramoeba flamelloides]
MNKITNENKYYVDTFRGPIFSFCKEGIAFSSRHGRVSMEIVDGNYSLLDAQDQLESMTTFIQKEERSQSPNYRSLRYSQVLKNVDLEFELVDGHLKSSFFLQKGQDLDSVKWKFETNFDLSISKQGSLEFRNSKKELILVEHSLIFIQQNEKLEGKFVLDHENKIVTFQITDPKFNPMLPLIVDPSYSTYVGTQNDDKNTRSVIDEDGNVYATGITYSDKFKTTDGVYLQDYQGSGDIFLIKLNSLGELVYSTYFGTTKTDLPTAITLDSSGLPIIAGTTADYELNNLFPTSTDAYKKDCDGSNGGAFITKFNDDASSLVFSTFICSDQTPTIKSIKTDESDAIFITGNTEGVIPPTGETGPNFNCVYGNLLDAFVAKLSSDGTSLLNAICINGAEDDTGMEMALSDTSIYITGYTESEDLPFTTGKYQEFKNESTDCFIAKLDRTDLSIMWVTYVGATKEDTCNSISLDTNEDIWVGGSSFSTDFPVTDNAYKKIINNEENGIFFKMYNNGTDLGYSSYLNGTDAIQIQHIVIDEDDLILLGGMGSLLWQDYEYDYDYGNDGFVVLFDSLGKTIQKSIKMTITSMLSLGNYQGTNWNWVGSGEVNTPFLKTTSNAFQQYEEYIDGWIITLEMYCKMGTYSDIEGCLGCPEGTYSDEELQDSCKECGMGEHNSYTGQTECVICEPGTYSDQVGLPDCLKCPEGTYNTNNGSESSVDCSFCPIGTYNPETGASSEEEGCLPCPVGTYNPNQEGRSVADCKKCPEGSYNTHTGSNSSVDCLTCPSGKYSETGSSECEYCGPGTEPSDRQSECVECSPGTYSESDTQENCKSCKSGYFNNEAGQSSCKKCLFEDNCIGGNSCLEGRNNSNYCITCLDGWFMLNSECRECLPGYVVWLVVSLIFVLCLVIYFTRNLKYTDSFLEFTSNPIFGIIVTSLQLIGVVLSLDFPWPSLCRGFLRYFFSIFILDFWSMSSPDCKSSFTFYYKWLTMFLLFFILFFFSLIFYLVQNLRLETDHERRYNFQVKFKHYFLLLLKFIYIPFLKISFDTIDLTYYEVKDASLLDVDPSINASTRNYKNYLVGFIIGFILYVVGIPIVFGITILKAKQLLFAEDFNEKYGWIYMKYKENRYWFEMVEFFFKFLIVLSCVFFKPNSEFQAVYVFVIFFAFIALFCYLKPHEGYYTKYVTEDKTEIGLYTIVWSIASLGITSLDFLPFVILYPAGFVFAYLGIKENLTNYYNEETWEENYDEKKDDKDFDDNIEDKPKKVKKKEDGDEDDDLELDEIQVDEDEEEINEIIDLDENLTEYEKNVELLRIRKEKNEEMSLLREELEKKENILKSQNETNFKLKNENNELKKENKKIKKSLNKEKGDSD